MLVPIVFALSGSPIYVAQSPLAPLIKPKNLVNEELTRSFQYLFEFRFGDLPNGVKNDVMFKCEKPLWANEARLINLAALTISSIQRN